MSGNNLHKQKERPRILLVDNDENVLNTLKKTFEDVGFVVAMNTNGQDALNRAKKFQPHLVILDLVLNEVDGIEICQEMKLIPGLEKTLLAFYTSRAEDYSQIAAFTAGADDYILKPLHPNVMV